jgi:hypothetical protein
MHLAFGHVPFSLDDLLHPARHGVSQALEVLQAELLQLDLCDLLLELGDGADVPVPQLDHCKIPAVFYWI